MPVGRHAKFVTTLPNSQVTGRKTEELVKKSLLKECRALGLPDTAGLKACTKAISSFVPVAQDFSPARVAVPSC
jgi:hypothetical protein